MSNEVKPLSEMSKGEPKEVIDAYYYSMRNSGNTEIIKEAGVAALVLQNELILRNLNLSHPKGQRRSLVSRNESSTSLATGSKTN